MTKISPHTLFRLILILMISIITTSTWFALQSPGVNESFFTDQENIYIKSKPDIAITSISSTNGIMSDIPTWVLIEEPDVLETHTQYNEFMQWQAKANKIFSADNINIHFADNSTQSFQAYSRGLGDLPFEFYLQIIAGILCITIGSSIWIFNRGDLSSLVYCFMGVMISASCFTSAIYTTREFAIDATLFRAASIINHLGAIGFGSGLFALFLAYPKKLLPPIWIKAVLASTFIIWLGDTFQFHESTVVTFHIWMLIFLALAFSAAGIQWFKSRRQARDRATLKWLLLSIMASVTVFTASNIIPVVLHGATLGPQAITLSGFAAGFIVMALGLKRYKLFNLDRWWYQYWMWLLAGGLVLATDLLLVSLLHIGQLPALSLALAIIGWGYFPIRQWLWGKLGKKKSLSLKEILPDIANRLFAAKSKNAIHEAWQGILQSMFSPLNIETGNNTDKIAILNDGQTLSVPSLADMPSWEIHFPQQGRQLFSKQDVDLVVLIDRLVHSAFNGLSAKEQGMQAERSRIKRDLHDDLGARLLSLSHSMNLDDSQKHARQAIEELRYILSALEQENSFLEESLETWQSECRERASMSGLELEWQQNLDSNTELASNIHHCISRVLRELTSNVLKHSTGDTIFITTTFKENVLKIDFSDNGEGLKNSQQSADGRGRNIIKNRLAEIQGSLEWASADNGLGVRALIQIPMIKNNDNN